MNSTHAVRWPQVRQDEIAEPPMQVPIGHGRSLSVIPLHDGAVLRLQAGGQVEMEVEITATAAGPVIRTRAAALELNAATTIHARCEEFRVEAERRIELRSGGDMVQVATGQAEISAQRVSVEAITEGVKVRANDDVQLLGEHILLNCDLPPVLPPWVPIVQPPIPTMPTERASGDPSLLDALRDAERDAAG